MVSAARAWIGTPYVHQASAKGAGCDCVGLLCGLWREAFGAAPEALPPYSAHWAEPAGREILLEGLGRHMTAKPIAARAPGDVLVFRMRKGALAKHLGLMGQGAPSPTFIHAYSGRGVVESALSAPWARRIAGVFAFPEEAL